MKERRSEAMAAGLMSVPFQGAAFDRANKFIEIPKDKLHAMQPTLVLPLDLPKTVAMGKALVGPGQVLCGVKTGRPVLLIMVCVGKVVALAALNPLDTETRFKMREAAKSGALTCAFLFDIPPGARPAANLDYALSTVPVDMFTAVLEATEGMAAVSMKEWLLTANDLMATAVTGLGIADAVLSQAYVRPFVVLPESEANG